MKLNEQIKKSFIFHGLPCICFDSLYVLFDPINLKMCAFTNVEELYESFTISYLNDLGFFLDPVPCSLELNEKSITLILTTDCNLACPYCYTNSKINSIYLDPIIAISILNSEIDKNKPLYIQYFGGEPTLNFECIKVVTDFVIKKHSDPFFYITTNGVMSDKILNYLLDKAFAFYLSIDGTEEYHNRNRYLRYGNAGSYNQVIYTLKKILSHNLSVKVRCTVTDSNINNMFDFAKNMFDLGVKILHFCPKINIGLGATTKQQINQEEFQNSFIENLDNIFNLAKEKNARVITPATLAIGQPLTSYCKIFTTNNKILITPDGKRTLCFGAQDEYNPISNSFIYADFDLTNKEFIMRKGIKESLFQGYQKNLTKCKSCFAKFMCQGGCLAENLTLSGKVDILNDTWCQMHRKLWYLVITRIFKNSIKIGNKTCGKS